MQQEAEKADSQGGKGKDTPSETVPAESDWGEEIWKEKGIEQGGAVDRVTKMQGTEKPHKGKGKAPEGAPRGPSAFPLFCQLCKIYRHSDLTCYL